MGAQIGQQGPSFTLTRILAIMGLVAAATTGYFFAVPGGSTGGMLFKESTAAGTPAAGERVVYAKSGGMYQKDSAGTESNLGGGTQNGTTGATTNALVKATAANTLGDSGLINASGGAITVANDTAISLTAGTISAGTAGQPVTIKASPAKAASGGAGGDVIVDVGDEDGAGQFPTVLFKRSGVTKCAMYPGADTFWFYAANKSTPAQIQCGSLNIGAGGVHFTGSSVYQSATNVVGAYGTGGVGDGWFQNRAGSDYATDDQTVDSTTLTADDTVSVTLGASRKYKFTYVYYFTPGDTAADGLKFDLNGGTATMTGIEARVRIVDNAGQDIAVTNSRMTALNTAVSVAVVPTTAFTLYVDGFCEVNGAGTMIANFAKAADVGTGLTKKKYTQIEFKDYP